MMTLAKAIRLPVAEVVLQRYGQHPALLVKRFDRELSGTQQVKRRYVIDACQALNLPPEYKYERNFGSGRDVRHIREGANLPQLFALCRASSQAALETHQLLDQVLFNLCINNHDAQGKNYSFFVNRRGLQLTPAYDLVNIALYPAFDQEMAMALGDEFDSRTVNADQLADFADTCQLPRAWVASRLRTLTQALLDQRHQMDGSEFAINQDEQRFITALLDNVQSRCEHLLIESNEINGMVF